MLFSWVAFLQTGAYNNIYRVAPKIAQSILNTLTLSNINRFSKFFHSQNQEKMCNNNIASVGIDLKELGVRVSCRNVWNFAQGLKFKADFYSKMSACRHELGGGVQPPTIPTLIIAFIAKDPTTPQVCRYTTLWNVSDQWGDQWNAATVISPLNDDRLL